MPPTNDKHAKLKILGPQQQNASRGGKNLEFYDEPNDFIGPINSTSFRCPNWGLPVY